jgi:hypothetical protein
MKKKSLISIVLFFVATCFFIACKKDEAARPVSGSVVGNWELKYENGTYIDSSTTPPTFSHTQVGYTPGKIFVEYKSDNTYSSVDNTSVPPDTENGTYTINGDVLTSSNVFGGTTIVQTSRFIVTADSMKLIFTDNIFADLHIDTFTYARR